MSFIGKTLILLTKIMFVFFSDFDIFDASIGYITKLYAEETFFLSFNLR